MKTMKATKQKEYVVDGTEYMKVWDEDEKMWVIVDPESQVRWLAFQMVMEESHRHKYIGR